MNGTKARLPKLQSGEKRYQAAVSRVKDEIAALGAGFGKDRNYLVRRLDYSSKEMFSGLVRKLVEEGRQGKMNIYEESQQTMNVYPDGLQSREGS